MTATVEPPRTEERRTVSPGRAVLIGLSAVPHLVCGIVVARLVSRTRDDFELLGVELPLFTGMFINSPPMLWAVVGVGIAAGVLVFSFLPGRRRIAVQLHVAGAVLGLLSYSSVWVPFVKLTEAYAK